MIRVEKSDVSFFVTIKQEGYKLGKQILENGAVKAIGNWHTRRVVPIQEKIDNLGRQIEAKFAPLVKFNEWLNSNGEGDWYKKLATFLVKLPARSARNIINLLYSLIKGAIYATVHPVQALHNAADLLMNLLKELTKPETWAKLGVGIMGASIGQTLITGNPLSVIGFGIGSALAIGGITTSVIKSILGSEHGKEFETALDNLFKLSIALPEAALTGFFMGLLMGGMQKIITHKVTNMDEARELAHKIVKENHLPQYSEINLDPSGQITIRWDPVYYTQKNVNLDFFIKPVEGVQKLPYRAALTITPESSILTSRYITYDFNHHFNEIQYLEPLYPNPVASLVDTLTPAIGSIAIKDN